MNGFPPKKKKKKRRAMEENGGPSFTFSLVAHQLHVSTYRAKALLKVFEKKYPPKNGKKKKK